jgi:hypothetical protein
MQAWLAQPRGFSWINDYVTPKRSRSWLNLVA